MKRIDFLKALPCCIGGLGLGELNCIISPSKIKIDQTYKHVSYIFDRKAGILKYMRFWNKLDKSDQILIMSGDNLIWEDGCEKREIYFVDEQRNGERRKIKYDKYWLWPVERNGIVDFGAGSRLCFEVV